MDNNYDFKRRIYEVLEVSSIGDASSRAYDKLMTVAIIVGLVPLTLKGNSSYTLAIDIVVSIFAVSGFPEVQVSCLQSIILPVSILRTIKWDTEIIELILHTSLLHLLSLTCFLFHQYYIFSFLYLL